MRRFEASVVVSASKIFVFLSAVGSVRTDCRLTRRGSTPSNHRDIAHRSWRRPLRATCVIFDGEDGVVRSLGAAPLREAGLVRRRSALSTNGQRALFPPAAAGGANVEDPMGSNVRRDDLARFSFGWPSRRVLWPTAQTPTIRIRGVQVRLRAPRHFDRASSLSWGKGPVTCCRCACCKSDRGECGGAPVNRGWTCGIQPPRAHIKGGRLETSLARAEASEAWYCWDDTFFLDPGVEKRVVTELGQEPASSHTKQAFLAMKDSAHRRGIGPGEI